MRFSLRMLLGGVAFVGLACAALYYATDWWETGLWTAAFLGLTAAGIGALCLDGRRRAWCIGFVFAGAAYLLLVFSPWFKDLGKRLLSTQVLEMVRDERFPRTGSAAWQKDIETRVKAAVPGVDSWNTTDNGETVTVHYYRRDIPQGRILTLKSWTSFRVNFISIGHTLSALLVALAGGALGRFLYRRPTQEE